MGLEPTTFCMASRPAPVVAHRFLPAKTAFSRSTRGAGLPSFRHVSPGFCQPIVNGSTRIRIVSGARRLARSTASVCRSGSLTCASAARPPRDPAGTRWRRSRPSDGASGESRSRIPYQSDAARCRCVRCRVGRRRGRGPLARRSRRRSRPSRSRSRTWPPGATWLGCTASRTAGTWAMSWRTPSPGGNDVPVTAAGSDTSPPAAGPMVSAVSRCPTSTPSAAKGSTGHRGMCSGRSALAW
jgi:hypothetical protein